MKFAVAATLFALAVAQTRDDIPKCGLDCIDAAITADGTCSTTNYSCICPKLNDLQLAAAPCVLKACGSDVAINQVLPAAQALCKAQGTAPASSSAAATSSAASSSAASTSAAASTTAASTTAAATTTSAAATTTKATTVASQSSKPSNGTVTATSSIPHAGAAGLSAGAAAIALAVLAL